MQDGLSPGDRKLLSIAGILALALMIASVALSPSDAGLQGSETPSTYSPGRGGAMAAYLLLLDLRYPVQRWEDPPAGLASGNSESTLIIAEPTVMPTAHERSAIVDFVRQGGRLLYCGNSLDAFVGHDDLKPVAVTSSSQQFSAKLPGYLTRGARTIEMEPRAYWGTLKPTQLAIYGENDQVAVVAWRLGKGEVVWWAAATPLTNSGIRNAGNLNLFLNSVSGAAPLCQTIYWDEYFHGERGSLWAYLAKTPLPWGGAQIVILFLALLFAFGRRSGPMVATPRVSRLSPLEFIDTMGGLYQRAGARSIAVAAAYRHLRLELTRRLGLPVSLPDSDLAAAATMRLGLDAELAATLSGATAASNIAPTKTQSLRLTQRLAAYSAQLATPRPQRKNH